MQEDERQRLLDGQKNDSSHAGISTTYDRDYVPEKLLDSEAFATFRKELVNAVTCCEAVEQTQWSTAHAQDVIRGKKGRTIVRAVSLPSEPHCTQRFMAFEANEDGHTTYILAFRSDQDCFHDMPVSSQAEAKKVAEENIFEAHQSLWWRAATVPLQSLPPLWLMGLREHGHRLILTGFSVGGAVAALATLRLLQVEIDIREQICCYTFGTPLHGGENYANLINRKYLSNFYHVMMDGDPVPGVLTLVGKIAENQPTMTRYVVSSIFKLLAVSAQVVASVAIDSQVFGAGGPIVELVANAASQIDFSKLGNAIRSLIAADRNSETPLPQYKFGGSLALLYMKQNSGPQMTFVKPPGGDLLFGNDPVLDEVFSVQGKHTTSNFGLKTFSHVIFDLNYLQHLNIIEAIGSAPAEKQHPSGRTPMDRLPDLVGNGIKDGASQVAKSTKSAAKSVARRCFGGFEVYLLEPRFDIEKPMEGWLNNHGVITINVYGQNMVLGMHVLYIVNGKEKLRIPCVEGFLPQQFVGSSKDPQISMQQPLTNRPLQFRTQSPKGLQLYKEEGGVFVVQLAFGSTEVLASTVEIRNGDSMDAVQVAELFSATHPSKLIDPLLFWGVAMANAQCTAAFYAIKENSQRADDIVSKMVTEFSEPPVEFTLLDGLLALVDTSHIPIEVLNNLKPDAMRQSILLTRNAVKPNVIVPYFSADNEWTFSECFKRNTRQLLSKDKLSEKESVEKLSKSLYEDMAGPMQMLRAYLNHEFQYKKYRNEFSSKGMIKWKKEKKVAKKATNVVMVGGACLPLLTIPMAGAGCVLESDYFFYMAALLGAPTGLSAAGLAGVVWALYHALLTPVRWHQNRPGLMDDLMRTKHLAGTWEEKLLAALNLFEWKSELDVPCNLEHELYGLLKDPTTGCFDVPTRIVQKSSYEADVRFQLIKLALAGGRVINIRRHLTVRGTALALIGTTQAGKTTLAYRAFGAKAIPGSGINDRTRVLSYETVDLPNSWGRQFTLIDFPGVNDHASQQALQQCYIDKRLLANVFVVVSSLTEVNTSQTIDLVIRACKMRRKEKLPVLFCFTYADVRYENYRDDAEGNLDVTAELFSKNFEAYKKDIIDAVMKAEGDTDQMEYISSNMHACCFARKLQDESLSFAQELKAADVKNVQWVKDWCVEKLLEINRTTRA